jgi:hypothetical protein
MRSRRGLIIGIAAGLVAVVVFLAVQFGPSAMNANTVVEYVSEAEHYSVMAPGAPTPEHEELIGAITTTTTRWTDDQLHYSVSSTDGQDLPPSLRGNFLHAVLVEALTKAPGVTAASLETSAVTDAFLAQPDATTLSGGPAVRFLLTVEGAPAPFHVVFAGHGTTLYLLVLSESADSRDDEFLESFVFLD